MFARTAIPTAFKRARRYLELSRAFRERTQDDPTLSPECPPYETQYGAGNIFAQTDELADVAAFYRACGLAAPAHERVDHLAVELEFMGFLALKEAYALVSNESERARETREMARRFFAEHLDRWAESFLDRFETRAPEESRRLRRWLRTERRLLGISTAAGISLRLRGAEDPNEPFVCGGAPCPLA